MELASYKSAFGRNTGKTWVGIFWLWSWRYISETGSQKHWAVSRSFVNRRD